MNNKSMVIAGVVKTINTDLKTAKVVALGTGTKAINAELMYRDGTVLMNGHAEVVARRALMHYFYDQIELCLDPGKTFIKLKKKYLKEKLIIFILQPLKQNRFSKNHQTIRGQCTN